MKSLSLVVMSVAFLLSAPAMAEVYKYVDANGKVVFSDQPPPGAKAKSVNVRATQPAIQASAPAGKAKTPLSEADKKNAEIDAENAKINEKNKKTAQQNCKNAQDNLAGLQKNGRVYVPGSNNLASDAQRQAFIQEAQKNVQSWCNQ